MSKIVKERREYRRDRRKKGKAMLKTGKISYTGTGDVLLMSIPIEHEI